MGIKYFFSDISDGNLAFHVGDKKENVEKNREKLAIKYGYDNHKLVYMNQVHGNNIVIVDENRPQLIEDCDAIITKTRNLPLMVMVADCIPVLLFDEKVGLISAIHAGRNSTFLEIVKKTAQIFIEKFSSNPEDIKAILGPSIQKCCYEISAEMAKIVENSFGKSFVDNRNIDLQNINMMQLNSLGIKDVYISDVCTKCSNKPYFSYRDDHKCGRFAAVIELK